MSRQPSKPKPPSPSTKAPESTTKPRTSTDLAEGAETLRVRTIRLAINIQGPARLIPAGTLCRVGDRFEDGDPPMIPAAALTAEPRLDSEHPANVEGRKAYAEAMARASSAADTRAKRDAIVAGIGSPKRPPGGALW